MTMDGESRIYRAVDVEIVEVTHTHTMLWFRLEESRSAQQVGQQTQSDLSELSDLHAAEPDG